MAASGTDRPLSLPAAALWATALWLLEHIAFEVTEALRPGAITDIVNISACVVLATSLIVFAMVRVHAPEESLRATLGMRAVGPVSIVLAAALGVGLCPALSTVDDLVARRWPYDDPQSLESMNKLLASSTHLGLVLGVFVVIPLAREVFFRGLLFGELQRARGIGIGRGSAEGGGASSTALALVATAVLFAVFSLDWRSMPTALVLGLVLGWLRARTGSLVAPAVAHLAFWSVEGIPILRGADPAADVTYPTRWIVGGARGIAARALARVARAGAHERPS